jgi:hypothetical protein
MKRRINVFKKTKDNWYPNYEERISGDSLVEVSFMKLYPSEEYPENYRVCIWGADDFGMEKDFVTENEAWVVFLEVIGLEFVNHRELEELGFIPT